MRRWLAPLEPIGVGTPFVEALPSYESRLRAVHQISLRKLRAAALGAAGSTSKSPSGPVVIGIRAREIADGLASLTGRDRLRSTTFVGLQQAVELMRSLRRTRSICVSCLATDRDRYIRLAWMVRSYTHCIPCGSPMSDRCSSKECGSDLGRWDLTGSTCPACGSTPSPSGPTGDPPLSARVLELVTAAHEGWLVAGRISAGASALVTLEGSKKELATRIAVSDMSVGSVILGRGLASAETLLALAARAGSLRALTDHGTAQLRTRRMQSTPRTARIDREAVRAQITDLLRSSTAALTTREVARRVGVSTVVLSRQLPHEMALVVRGGRLVRERARAEREARLIEVVRQNYALLINEGRTPTKNAIARASGRKWLFREPLARAVFEELSGRTDAA